ncbi:MULTISPECIES: ubiquitin-like protein Pup [Streptomyces]|uniref:ubiquitin-like protein Pup n=1 Tax=Streptomyces TaxID=1883 RepID=UPI0023DD4C36|nr:ubiquitin-like protein Pup [Streptomyces sp. FXJ1.172]WEP00629.1 ubiquitin-like protein Pup [Streptomyces sp. FXJ1.172]
MPGKQERKPHREADQEEATAADTKQPEVSTASGEEASSQAADVIDSIDEVLDEFDDLTLSELGFQKGDRVDSPEVDEAVRDKVMGFVQKGGQ